MKVYVLTYLVLNCEGRPNGTKKILFIDKEFAERELKRIEENKMVFKNVKLIELENPNNVNLSEVR